ncbi:MAG: ATP-dependent DNA helicase RecG [Pseudomonadota bacterium]
MAGRPEILFPLFGDIQRLSGIGPKSAQALAKAGIATPRDLLFTLPHGVINRQSVETIKGLTLPEIVSVEVEILEHRPNRIKTRPYRILVRDAGIDFHLGFFHGRADYLAKTYPVGARRVISGKIEVYDHTAQMMHPDFVVTPDKRADIPASEPVYPLTQGITQRIMRKATDDVLHMIPDFAEWQDPSVLKDRNWPKVSQALEKCHRPEKVLDKVAFDRLAYDELLAHQLTLSIARARHRAQKGQAIQVKGTLAQQVLDALPFKPTDAQRRSFAEIRDDLASTKRMNRLLQGDVGSGKTLVGLVAMLDVAEAGGQSVLMAPTGILARQHFTGLTHMAKPAGVEIILLTGADTGAKRREKLERLKSGDAQIVIGTHAVFSDDVEFQDLRFAIIDEQHRFGVRQRLELGKKGDAVDVMVMSATPIPRSLELAHYGDMDVSILDEKPAGRQPIDTAMVSIGKLDAVVARLRAAIGEGKQAYWVCPLVEESEKADLSAATDRAVALQAALGAGVGLVHGRMSQDEKDAAMASFVAGQTSVLVATTVIEVGVDVPNATIIVIEQAERFGLAQLHQLRGRVGRGADKSACVLLYKNPLGKTAQRRLEAIRETEDGFKLAEVDLAIRGAGDILGTAQAGLPKFRIADLERDMALMQMARDDARLILERDPSLESPRGQALKTLLYLMGADDYIGLLKVG